MSNSFPVDSAGLQQKMTIKYMKRDRWKSWWPASSSA